MAERTLKIGITGYPVYGGSGVVATELGLELALRGHEIHFITYAQPFRLSGFVENVYYHEVEVPSTPSSSTRPTPWRWPSRCRTWWSGGTWTSSTSTTPCPTPRPPGSPRSSWKGEAAQKWSPPSTAPTSPWSGVTRPTTPSPASP
jgi:hypothetical protein